MRMSEYIKYISNSTLINSLKNNNAAFAKALRLEKGEVNADQVDESKEVNKTRLSKILKVDHNNQIQIIDTDVDSITEKLRCFTLGNSNSGKIKLNYLTCVSRDSDLNYYYDSTRSLKYLNLPEMYQDPRTGKKVYNLFYGWWNFTGFAYRRDVPRLIGLFKALQQYEITNEKIVESDFLANKSILKYLMAIAGGTDIMNKVQANVKLTKDGFICLSTNNYRSRKNTKYTFAGHSFENTVSFDEISTCSFPVSRRFRNSTMNDFESYYLLLNMIIENANNPDTKNDKPISVIFTGEVDCCLKGDKPVDDLSNYLELKCFSIKDVSQINSVFQNEKLVSKIKHSYFQSLISGGNLVVAGFRTDDGYLADIRTFTHKELEETLGLDKQLIFSNFYSIMSWIRDNVTDAEKSYRLFLDKTTVRLQEYQDEANCKLIGQYVYDEGFFQYREGIRENKF